MVESDKNYTEVDGEITPLYTGEINGPRDSDGIPMSVLEARARQAEREVELYETADDVESDEDGGQELSLLAQRAFAMAERAGRAALVDESIGESGALDTEAELKQARSIDGMSGEEVAKEFLRDPDQFGSEWPSLQFSKKSKPEVASAPGRTGSPKRPSSKEQNSNEARARAEHWKGYGRFYRKPGQTS